MNDNETPEWKELNRLMKELMDLYYEIALKSGLSGSAFDILYAMVSMGSGCLQKDIAEYYCISKQTINSSIKKLEAQGYITLEKGKRRELYIHLTPADAEELGVKDKQVVWVKLATPERSAVLGDVVCRVSEKYARAMHIDTDESNAVGAGRELYGEIVEIG